jgi:putative transposase
VTQRDWDDAALIDAALDVHHDDPEFGYRLITDELRDQGHQVSENRIGRLCSQQQIFSSFAKKKGLRGKPGPAVHDDLVKRKFTATSANTLWLTDITEHRTAWIPAVVATRRVMRVLLKQ